MTSGLRPQFLDDFGNALLGLGHDRDTAHGAVRGLPGEAQRGFWVCKIRYCSKEGGPKD